MTVDVIRHSTRGGSRIFIGGGGGSEGGAKDYVPARASRARSPISLTVGVQDPLIKDPESSRVCYALSCFLSL